ncbi:MAG: DUF2550 domain-containing protein [Acidothermaceae bacterium]
MVFDILDSAGTLVLLAVLALVVLIVRHTLLRRSGATLHCALRLGTARAGRGWHVGVMRYSPGRLQWFRLFSVAPNPKVALLRRSIEVVGRRSPRGFELHSIPHGAVIARCIARTPDGEAIHLELAMGERALTGFLAWLESAPPGAHQSPDVRRA